MRFSRSTVLTRKKIGYIRVRTCGRTILEKPIWGIVSRQLSYYDYRDLRYKTKDIPTLTFTVDDGDERYIDKMCSKLEKLGFDVCSDYKQFRHYRGKYQYSISMKGKELNEIEKLLKVLNGQMSKVTFFQYDHTNTYTTKIYINKSFESVMQKYMLDEI